MDHVGDNRSSLAQVVLIFLSKFHGVWIDNFQNGINTKSLFCDTATPTVSLWNNGSERGYFVSLKRNNKQLNIIFFEHKNSDDLIVEHFIHDMEPKDVYEYNDIPKEIYKDKFNYDISFPFDKPYDAASYIQKFLEHFYQYGNDELIDYDFKLQQ